jgi:acetate kinase
MDVGAGSADEPVIVGRVLVVNAGSSSLKLRLLDGDDALAGSVDLPADGGHVDDAALSSAVADLEPPDAVGHRVVHGGTRFTSPVVVDDDVLDALDELSTLAPLHQPTAVELIRLARRLLPATPAVACLDTAFHATIPPAAATYPVPARWRDELGVRRYGFHGLSHAWAARRAAAMVGQPVDGLRTVTAHLGAGASLAAVDRGVSVDTTMGFTPLDGLVMATRSGALDPGLVAWLSTQGGLAVDEVEDALYHRSGLTALAGTGDLREIAAAVDAGDPAATLALDVYVHRLRASIASMAAAMGGLDVLVFTGGVGEHSALVRQRTGDGVGFLGVGVDPPANAAVDGDADITATGASVRTLVVTAREDLEIARQTRAALG